MTKQCNLCWKFCDELKEIKTPYSLLQCCLLCLRKHYLDKFYKNKYGITVEQKVQKLEEQKFKCSICHISIDFGAFQDYNRKLKKGQAGFLRGLLCLLCHKKLNWYEKRKSTLTKRWMTDNVNLIIKFESYLAFHTNSESTYNEIIQDITNRISSAV